MLGTIVHGCEFILIYTLSDQSIHTWEWNSHGCGDRLFQLRIPDSQVVIIPPEDKVFCCI